MTLSVDLLEKQLRLSEDDARKIYIQIVYALAFCQSNNVCHRDIKLENVLVDPGNLFTKLTEFGFSETIGDHIMSEKMNTFCGTLYYLAPEILETSGYSGFHTDMWASGVLLYILTTGR